MDYKTLLKIAEGKKAVAQFEKSRSESRAKSVAPTKKGDVQPDAIKSFLARKRAEELQKAEEARKKKEELLTLREMSKSKTKARIMASRTKDNDFSRIKLTDEELEAKKRRENELLKLSLKDKVSRMKARIELEEKEKLLPKKRKRKLKDVDAADCEQEEYQNASGLGSSNSSSKMQMDRNGNKECTHKKPKLQPPSFHELLEIAKKKQFEPVKALPIFKDDDDRPLTKKARRLLQEEENSIRRKLAAEAAEKSGNTIVDSIPNEAAIKKLPKIALKKRLPCDQNSARDSPKVVKKEISNGAVSASKKPSVIHVQKQINGTNQNKSPNIPRRPSNLSSLAEKPEQRKQNSTNNQIKPVSSQAGKVTHLVPDKHKEKLAQKAGGKVSENGFKKSGELKAVKKEPTGSVSKPKVINQKKPVEVLNSAQNNDQLLMNETLIAEIERRVRSQVQKELEAKLMQQQKQNQGSTPKSQPPESVKLECRTKTPSKLPVQTNSHKQNLESSGKDIKMHSSNSGEKRTVSTQKMPSKVVGEKTKPGVARKDPHHPSVSLKAKLPQKPAIQTEKPRKPAFHPNPYLEPPRRLLESRRPQKLMRRLDSDDEEEDDDDMNDFIDDGCGDDAEDYSKYIKEIFNYDRSRYLDEDDDDVIESSFVEQMKEEVRSAKIGLQEDLEDIMKEQEEQRRKMLKKKK